jgi:hypothetical protein
MMAGRAPESKRRLRAKNGGGEGEEGGWVEEVMGEWPRRRLGSICIQDMVYKAEELFSTGSGDSGGWLIW